MATHERVSVSAEHLKFMVEKTETSAIEVAGGLAVIRTWEEHFGIGDFPWLIGMSAHTDGSSSYAFHRLTRDPCEDSAWCIGAILSAEERVTQTLGAGDPMPASSRFWSLEAMLRQGSDPSLPENSGALSLTRQFYEEGHTFDPTTQPVLYEAMRQIVRSGA